MDAEASLRTLVDATFPGAVVPNCLPQDQWPPGLPRAHFAFSTRSGLPPCISRRISS